MLCALALGLGLALSGAAAQVLPPSTASVTQLASQHWDYVIVGGGTAGLTLAVLLSENSSKQVLVLDRGTYRPGDVNLEAPGLWTAQLGNTTYDYVLTSVPQPQANDSVIEFSRGKTLGGTSALNSMVYMPPSKHEFDAVYPIFGDASWTWDNFIAFARMSEHFTPAPPAVAGPDNAQQNPSLHGTSGALQVAYADFFPNLVPPYFSTMGSLGVPPNNDPRAAGTNVGSFSATINVDPSSNKRSYAVSAFYEPNKSRSNLVVVASTQVTKVLFSGPDGSGNVTATGVEFVSNGTTASVNGSTVVLSAGVFFTPQLLELSGIGNKTLLSTLGINSVVDLPGVGENLQEHFAFNCDFFVSNDSQTFDELRDPNFAASQLALYLQNGTGEFSAGETAVAFVPVPAILGNATELAALSALIDDSMSGLSQAQQMQAGIIKGWLNDSAVGWAEVFPQFEWAGTPGTPPDPTQKLISLTTLMEHPLSRGSTHINSTDATVMPLIDPQIYAHPVDKALALATLKWLIGNVSTSGALGQKVTGPHYPAPGADDDALFDSLLKTVITGHTIGSTAMMPRAMGGVVDPNLQVYGTNNLFVVDTGVLPMEVSSHLDAFAYTLAFRTAAYLSGNSTSPAGNTTVSKGGKGGASRSRPAIAASVAAAGILLAALL